MFIRPKPLHFAIVDELDYVLIDEGRNPLLIRGEASKDAARNTVAAKVAELLMRLSGKHGRTNSLSKDWLYVVYSIFSGMTNAVDLTVVLWKDFWKFAINRKTHEISSPRFWALTIQQLYKEINEPIPISTIPEEVLLTFKTIKSYRLLD
uniref:chloroplast protein-transporting ATPase n=1 Tax=Lactuca sativa TaxID=4236 RepID=A0A9R1UNV5_LACSA|nr:hypothetical protein LSAT_V11C800417130 [Lactuca sativa]